MNGLGMHKPQTAQQNKQFSIYMLQNIPFHSRVKVYFKKMKMFTYHFKDPTIEP